MAIVAEQTSDENWRGCLDSVLWCSLSSWGLTGALAAAPSSLPFLLAAPDPKPISRLFSPFPPAKLLLPLEVAHLGVVCGLC